jgi:hypothetical protein
MRYPTELRARAPFEKPVRSFFDNGFNSDAQVVATLTFGKQVFPARMAFPLDGSQLEPRAANGPRSSPDLSAWPRYAAFWRRGMQTGLISLRRSPAFEQVPVTVALTGQLPCGQFGVMLRALQVWPRYAGRPTTSWAVNDKY